MSGEVWLPEPWDVTLDRSRTLLRRVVDEDRSPELQGEIEELLVALQASGKITAPFERREDRSAALWFWAAKLGVMQRDYVAPLVVDDPDPTSPPEINSKEAKKLLAAGERIRKRALHGFRDGGTASQPQDDGDKYELHNCRMIGGRIQHLDLSESFYLAQTTLIGVDIRHVEARTFDASSIRSIGGGLTSLTVHDKAIFHRAAMRSATIASCTLEQADFKNADLGVGQSQDDPTGLKTFGELLSTLTQLGFTQGESVRFHDVTLPSARFAGALLDNVTFEDCTLGDLDFSDATSIYGLRFERCGDLSRVRLGEAPGYQTVTHNGEPLYLALKKSATASA